jgi:hypothetical protein
MGDKTFDFSFPLHLQINPPKKRTPRQKLLNLNPNVRRQFAMHGLKLNGGELSSLMAGRTQGIHTLDRILSRAPITSGMPADKRAGLAADLADMLMEQSLEAQLSREAPTLLDRNQQRDEILQHVLLGKVAKEFPLKAQITIHLPVSWL